MVAFWALVGQTPGMRLLSIHLEREGTRALGLRPALRRLVALPVAIFTFGLGVLAILVSPTRQGWHDRFAGTKVVYDQHKRCALGAAGGLKPAICGYERLFANGPPGRYVNST